MMLIVLFLIMMALLIYLVQAKTLVYFLAGFACLGAWILWFSAYLTSEQVIHWQSISFISDGISFLLIALILTLSTLVLIYSWGYFHNDPKQHQHLALFLLMMAFGIAVSLANDIFNLWLWFEGLGLAAVTLVAYYREDKLALEATLKYLIQSMATSSFLLLGIALIFAQTGSLSYTEIRLTSLENAWLLGAIFIVGFGVKAALVPLHTWLPDAHSQAPSGISAMLSGVVIEVALIAMLRVLMLMAENFGLLLMIFATLNILIGNLLAFKQDDLKRLLAYSSIAHMGYIVLGLGFGLYTGEATALSGGFFHLVSHGLMKALAFLALGTMLYVLFLSQGNHGTLNRDSLNGLGKQYPLIAVPLTLALLGLGGLPPMVGFLSKWLIFVGGALSGDNVVLIFLLIGTIGSILSLAYYAPLVNRIYREEVTTVSRHVTIPLSMRLPIIFLTIAICLLGVYPIILQNLIDNAALALAQFGH